MPSMLIGKPIRFLFFIILKWQTATRPAANPTIWATVIVTILLSLNILVVIQLLLWRSGASFIFRGAPNLARLLGYFCFALVAGFTWMSLVQSGRYKRLEQEFATASERRQMIRRIAFTLYLIVSTCLPFILKALLHNKQLS